jgi:Trypsin-like peptidase domain/S-layer homology domain
LTRRTPASAARHRGTRILVVLASILGVIGSAAPVQAADPAAAEAQRLEAYWTGDRIRAATPHDLVLETPPPGAGTVKAPATESGPAAAPGLADVDGADWNGGGAILQRSGLILFSIGPNDYSCSGSVISDDGDPSYSLILTAGHCAYDLETHTFTTNWIYIPAWDDNPNANSCAETTYGCWDARALVVHVGWTSESQLTIDALQHDYAVAVVGAVRGGSLKLDSLGAYPLKLAGVDLGDTLSAFGYPAAGPKYDGSDLVYCQGPAGVDAIVGSWALVCDMTGGASGGPWLADVADPATTAGAIASLSSYRLQGDNHLFGPVLDGSTAAVYELAKVVTPDATGIDHHTANTTVAVPFSDINGSTFISDIEWMYLNDITHGCAPTLYCPTATVTREQMAGFLVRAFDLPATGKDYFTDDETSTLEAEINALRASGITTGCAPGKYCPKGGVSREQMAAFLVRALDLPPSATDYFVDDEGRTFENDINALRKAGITTGCDATHFCPTATVTREQMAGFLHRAIGD